MSSGPPICHTTPLRSSTFSVGIRASFTQRLFQFVFFDWILVLIGFSPEAVYAMAAVHLLLAYWHHTQVIKRLGWFEKYFVTPSHHRVHHGVNPQYIDKNYSEFLIIWDKLFGTFEEEDEEICYGVTHPPRTWDPIFINFQYWKQLWDDAVAAPTGGTRSGCVFMPLGWRPRGLETEKKDRIGYTKAEQVKYRSAQYKNLKPYLMAHVAITLAYLMVVINLSSPLSALDRLILSGGVFMAIISWGGLLQARTWSIPLEVFRSAFMAIALILVLNQNEMANWTSWTTIVILGITGVSILYFSFKIKKGQLEPVPAE